MKKYLVFFLLVMFIAVPVSAKNRTVIRRQYELNAPQNAAQPQPVSENVPGNFNFNQRNALNNDGELVGRSFRHGFFVGPVAKFTQVNGESGFVAGGRGAWIINGNYMLGLGAYGLTHNIKANRVSSGVRPDMTMKYGGVELEYVIDPEGLIHFSVYTLLGMGSVEFDYANVDGDDNFFVVEPAVNVLVNLTTFSRIGLGVGYRIASGVDLDGLEDSDLGGFAATLTLKLGVF